MKQRINKSAFKKLRQSDLATFAQSVTNRMREQAEYAEALPLVEQLQKQNDAYQVALAECSFGGTDRVALKEELKTALVQTLTDLANWLNERNTDSVTWIVNTGFTLKNANGRNIEALLQPPFRLRAMPQKTRGELELRYNHEFPSQVLTTGLEYSLDNGNTWQNGTYSSRGSMKLEGLPSRQLVMFRVRAIGTGQRRSSWTQPIELFLM